MLFIYLSLYITYVNGIVIMSQSWQQVPLNVDDILLGDAMELTAFNELVCATAAKDYKLYCYDGLRCVVAFGGLENMTGPVIDGWTCRTSEKSKLTNFKTLTCFREKLTDYTHLKFLTMPGLISDSSWQNWQFTVVNLYYSQLLS